MKFSRHLFLCSVLTIATVALPMDWRTGAVTASSGASHAINKDQAQTTIAPEKEIKRPRDLRSSITARLRWIYKSIKKHPLIAASGAALAGGTYAIFPSTQQRRSNILYEEYEEGVADAEASDIIRIAQQDPQSCDVGSNAQKKHFRTILTTGQCMGHRELHMFPLRQPKLQHRMFIARDKQTKNMLAFISFCALDQQAIKSNHRCHTEDDRPYGEIQCAGIDQNYKNNGIEKALLKQAIGRLRSLGSFPIFSIVRASGSEDQQKMLKDSGFSELVGVDERIRFFHLGDYKLSSL